MKTQMERSGVIWIESDVPQDARMHGLRSLVQGLKAAENAEELIRKAVKT